MLLSFPTYFTRVAMVACLLTLKDVTIAHIQVQILSRLPTFTNTAMIATVVAILIVSDHLHVTAKS